MLLAGVPILLVLAAISALAVLVVRAWRDDEVSEALRAQLRRAGEVRRAVHEVRGLQTSPGRHGAP